MVASSIKKLATHTSHYLVCTWKDRRNGRGVERSRRKKNEVFLQLMTQLVFEGGVSAEDELPRLFEVDPHCSPQAETMNLLPLHHVDHRMREPTDVVLSAVRVLGQEDDLLPFLNTNPEVRKSILRVNPGKHVCNHEDLQRKCNHKKLKSQTKNTLRVLFVFEIEIELYSFQIFHCFIHSFHGWSSVHFWPIFVTGGVSHTSFWFVDF